MTSQEDKRDLEKKIARFDEFLKKGAKNLQDTTSSGMSHTPAIKKINNWGTKHQQDVTCNFGHLLVQLGTKCDDGWECKGAQAPGGCKSGITGPGQSKGLDRFACPKCNYDICAKCYSGKRRKKMKQLKEIIANQQQEIKSLKQIITKIVPFMERYSLRTTNDLWNLDEKSITDHDCQVIGAILQSNFSLTKLCLGGNQIGN